MDPTVKWFALGAGVFVVLILWMIVKAALSGRRRAAAIKEWAFRNGMSYVPGPVEVENVAKIPQDETPDNLIRRNAWNVISGRRGHYDVTVFDLHQTTGGYDTKTRTYTTKTVAVLKLPNPLPPFRFMTLGDLKLGSIRANMVGAVEKLAMKVDGGKHGTIIEIPDHPGLVLLSRDPDATRPLFTPAVIDYFAQHGGYGLTTEGTSMMVDRTMTRTTATLEQIETLINDASSIAQQFHQGF
jgi:hypothetical protein